MYKKYDIVYVEDLGTSNGSVQMYARPAVVMQNDKGNFFSPTTIVAFVTGKEKRNDLPTHVVLANYDLPKKSTVMLEQIATVSKANIVSRIDELREEDRFKVDAAVLISLGITKKEEVLVNGRR